MYSGTKLESTTIFAFVALVEELVVEDREAIGQEVADHQVASKHYRSVARNKGALSKSDAHVASKCSWQHSAILWGFWT